MFPWSHVDWGWGWGWGFVGAVGGIVVLAIFLVPWYFFLLNLQTILQRVNERNRAMQPGQVWLNFIPIFNLGWFIYTVVKVRDSVLAEYQSRGWVPDDDLGYNVGVAAGVLAIATFFLGWFPFIGWGATIAAVVCWIVYWLKTAELKNRLGPAAAAAGYAPAQPYYQPPGQAGPPVSQPPVVAPVPPTEAPPGAAGPPAGGPSPTETPAAAAPAVDLAEGAPSVQQPASGQAGQARVCAGCGSGFDPGDRFCRVCGLPLP